MDSLELLIRSGEELPEEYLLYELERTVRAVRQNPTNTKFRKELIALAMLLVSKDITKEQDVDSFVKEVKQISSLHNLFKGRTN